MDINLKFIDRGYEFISLARLNKRVYFNFKCLKHLDKGVLTIRKDSFLKGSGCKYCNYEKTSKRMLWTTDIFKSKIYEIVGNEYIVLGSYVSSNLKIDILHNQCGKSYQVTSGHFINGNRCPYCFGKYKNTEDIKKLFYSLVKDNYLVVGNFVRMRDKLEVKHAICGLIYCVSPKKFLQGIRCPNCTKGKSKLASKVEAFLYINKINYKKEFSFKDCVYKRTLRFDFAITDSYGVLHSLIEVDGKHHFEESFFAHSDVLIRDSIKNNYCIQNNLDLLRIPHTKELNIYKLLSSKFLKNIIPSSYLEDCFYSGYIKL